MEWRRVKNVLILMLLLVNGFLLVLVGTRQSEKRLYERRALEGAVQVMESNGIQVDRTALDDPEELTIQTMERDIDAERDAAATLLDQSVTGRNLGGGLYVYEGEDGQISFRAGGELHAILTDDDRWYAQNPQGQVEQLLKRMDVDARVMDTLITEGSGTVAACQMWEGSPLFSCQVVFTYEEGRLVSLTGRLMFACEVEREEAECQTLPTALMEFLDEIRDSGDVCSRILAMEAGYRMTQSYSGQVTLTPAWLISTNTANYYMDAVNGEVSRISGE